MATIGQLRPVESDNLKRLTGYLDTPEGRIILHMEGDPTLLGSNRPSHTIYQRSQSGHLIELGKAWLKTAKAGPNPESQFFSITFDSPYLDKRLNVAAFPNDEGGFDITWRSRKPTNN